MSILIEIPKRKGNKFTHKDASKYVCFVFADALRYGIRNNISVPPVSSHLRLPPRFAV